MGRTPFYRTLNELEHHFLNIEQTRALSSNSNTLFLALKEQTSDIEPNRVFIRFYKLLIELT